MKQDTGRRRARAVIARLTTWTSTARFFTHMLLAEAPCTRQSWLSLGSASVKSSRTSASLATLTPSGQASERAKCWCQSFYSINYLSLCSCWHPDHLDEPVDCSSQVCALFALAAACNCRGYRIAAGSLMLRGVESRSKNPEPSRNGLCKPYNPGLANIVEKRLPAGGLTGQGKRRDRHITCSIKPRGKS